MRCNLYVSDTVTGETRFIARLSGGDVRDWEPAYGSLGSLTAGVSPDGRYLAFMSDMSLTGYDNGDVHSGQPDEEVFIYDAGAGRLTCASCNPTGARPAGTLGATSGPSALVDRAGNWSGRWVAASIPGWTNVDGGHRALYRSRYLSDGGRLFFDAADALAPGDTNGAEDVLRVRAGGRRELSARSRLCRADLLRLLR